MQTKTVALSVIVLMTIAAGFSNTAQLASATANDQGSQVSSHYNVNNRLIKRSASDIENTGDSFDESPGDESGRGTEFEGMDLHKKASSFVRIGRYPTMNRFVRIGRMLNSEPSYRDHSYLDDFEQEYPDSPFAPSVESLSSSDLSRFDNEDNDLRKRASSFVRIGKSLNPPFETSGSILDNLKRTSHFVRFGRAPSSFVRIGKAPSSFVRIGKSLPSFVRIGRGPFSFVRIGKSPSDEQEKRASSFVRIGKNSDFYSAESPERLTSGFMDSGKPNDNNNNIDLLKRASSFVRIGKSGDEDKRQSKFVRFGKSDDGVNDENKRASHFVRIGKAESSQDLSAEVEKKASSFVRIGKSLHEGLLPNAQELLSAKDLASDNVQDEEQPIRLVNRGSAFVRIGKIPSSAFVRIGKNKDLILDPADYNRGSQGGQSTFVRIG